MTRHATLLIATTAAALGLAGCGDDTNYARRAEGSPGATTGDAETSGGETAPVENTDAPCLGESLGYTRVLIEHPDDATPTYIDAVSINSASSALTRYAQTVEDFGFFGAEITDPNRIMGRPDATCSDGFATFSAQYDYMVLSFVAFGAGQEPEEQEPVCVGDTIELHVIECDGTNTTTDALDVALWSPDGQRFGLVERQDDGTFRIVHADET